MINKFVRKFVFILSIFFLTITTLFIIHIIDFEISLKPSLPDWLKKISILSFFISVYTIPIQVLFIIVFFRSRTFKIIRVLLIINVILIFFSLGYIREI